MSSTPEPLVRSFSTLDEATAAVEALAAAGLSRDMVQLIVREDEAGPVSGNFLIGNGRTSHGRAPAAVRTGLEVPYDENFREPSYRGGFLVAVHGLEPAQAARARAELARFDCVAVNETAAAAGAAGPQ
jgi:hypothetical protein